MKTDDGYLSPSSPNEDSDTGLDTGIPPILEVEPKPCVDGAPVRCESQMLAHVNDLHLIFYVVQGTMYVALSSLLGRSFVDAKR